MAIENLGEPFLGPTSIPQSERTGWPSDFLPPKKIGFAAASAVTNEVYFRRSTARKRAAELLQTDVFYMVYHIGVSPDPTHFPTCGAGIVATDDDAGASDEGAGFYHDACNGLLLAEHVKDSHASLEITNSTGQKRTITTVPHFHVAGYSPPDEYSNLDFNKLYQLIVEETGAALQREMLESFGNGSRQYLPTYWHGARAVTELSGFDPTKVAFQRFIGLRVPAGLKARRGYQLKPELPKHHIYYLNVPGSEYHLAKADWR